MRPGEMPSTDEPDEATPMMAKLEEYESTGTPTRSLYDGWSQTYEADLIANLGYSAHVIAADAFVERHVDRRASILDSCARRSDRHLPQRSSFHRPALRGRDPAT